MTPSITSPTSTLTLQDLQHCEGPLASCLLILNSFCLRGYYPESDPPLEQVSRPVTAYLRDRQAAQALLELHGRTRWPGSYGQSPYQEVLAVIRIAASGFPLPHRGTRVERLLHDLWFLTIAPESSRSRQRLDTAGLWKRYPRLLQAMQYVAILTKGEVESTLRLLLRTHPQDRPTASPSCEATAHFGGNLRVVHQAIRRRRSIHRSL